MALNIGQMVVQVAKIGGGRGGLSIPPDPGNVVYAVSDDEGRMVTKGAPIEHADAGDLHERFPLLYIDPTLVKSMSSPPTRVREWTVHVRSQPDPAILGAPVPVRGMAGGSTSGCFSRRRS